MQVFADHHKLVPAEAGHRVQGAQRIHQAPADPDEQLVPRGVPQGIVDQLEAVDVQEQHRHQGLVALCAAEGLLEPVQQQGPVG